MSVPVDGEITTIEQTDGNHFFIGTGSGLFRAGIEEGKMCIRDSSMRSVQRRSKEWLLHINMCLFLIMRFNKLRNLMEKCWYRPVSYTHLTYTGIGS